MPGHGKFQFHKGTIRTFYFSYSLALSVYFNSIKVQLEQVPEDQSNQSKNYFNSIKVQLELTTSGENNLVIINFNSIKVQLELEKSSFTALALAYFNSIKVQLELSKPIRSHIEAVYFNSIKVQLEQPLQPEQNLNHIFQFHKGTIRTFASMKSCRLILNFNSIKVQLEQRAVVFSIGIIGISIP